ncbi:hypothetical protein C5D50_01905 [Rathayibacter sp. RFBD1]|nr:hypothetical protein C5D50_01905 [Rathayibacter sp. RFBD1]
MSGVDAVFAQDSVGGSATGSIDCPAIQRSVGELGVGSPPPDLGSPPAAAEVGESLFSSTAKDLLKSVVGSALGKVGDVAFGWVVSELTGPTKPTKIEAEELQDLADLKAQVTQVQTEIADLGRTIQTDVSALATEIDQDAKWQTFVTKSTAANTALQKVEDDIQQVCEITELHRDDAEASGVTESLTQEEIDSLKEVAENGQANFNALSAVLVGDDITGGLFEAYRDVLWSVKAVGSSSPSATLLSAEDANTLQSQVAYYGNIATLHLQAFAEVVHSPQVQTRPALLEQYYDNSWVPAIQEWSLLGNRNLPTLPAGTSVDLLQEKLTDPSNGDVSGTIRLWTTETVTLAGSAQNSYCMASVTCYAPEWAATSSARSEAVLRASVLPNFPPLSLSVGAEQLGLTGWRVPTDDDFASLVMTRPSRIKNPPSLITIPRVEDGVSQWAEIENVPALQYQPISNGIDTSNTIPPVVVDSDSAQVLVFTSNPYSGPERLTFAEDGMDPTASFGGRLMLVQDLPVGPPDTPLYPDASADSRAADAVEEAASAAAPPSASASTLSNSSAIGDASPVTYTAPAQCNTDDPYVQPQGYNGISVTVSGAAGGSRAGEDVIFDESYRYGGRGGVVNAVLPVSAGTQLFAGVGGAGGFVDGSQRERGAAGGIGGGGGGGTWTSDTDLGRQAGAGGGGLSSIALDDECLLPLVVAGGGGGAGAAASAFDADAARDGGNSCVMNGCIPSNSDSTLATNSYLTGATAPDGEGEDPYSDNGLGGGGGGGFIGGGASRLGGGTGGTSFVADGALSSSFTVGSNDSGTNGSVTITPVVIPEFTIGFVDSQFEWVLVRADQSVRADVPQDLLPDSSIVEWRTVAEPASVSPSGTPIVRLLDTVTGNCATGRGVLSFNQIVTLEPCADSDDNQRWYLQSTAVDPSNGSVNFRTIGGTGLAEAVSQPVAALFLTPLKAPPLSDNLSETPGSGPSDPAPTPTTDPAASPSPSTTSGPVNGDLPTDHSPRPAADSGGLASTGVEGLLLLATSIALIALGGLVIMSTRRRRA